jgi:hypothetical protein
VGEAVVMDVGRWAPRLAALVLGGVLGMAVGHGLAWLTIAPLPDDDQVRQIAAQFVPDLAGQVDRQDSWTTSPSGPVRALVGFSDVQPARVEVRFPADGTTAQRSQVEAVGERLRTSGWGRVWVDPDYPMVTGHYQGLDVRFGAVLSEPPPAAGPDKPPAEQEIVGLAVTIRQDTPAGAMAGLLVGALAGALLGLAAVAGVQRLLRGSDSGVRIAVVTLSAIGAAGLVPGTLASVFGLYLLAVEDLPHEPLWFAYSLMAPPTRPFAAAGMLLLVAAVAVASLDRLRWLATRGQ